MSHTALPHETGTPEIVESACQRLELPATVEQTAKGLYSRIYEEELYHGRSVEVVLAGTVYIACRKVGHACNPSHVATAFEAERDRLLGTARYLMKRLDVQFKTFQPEPYVDEIAETLALSEELATLARDIVSACRDETLHSGKSPTGVAAGAIYAAATKLDVPVTQDEISEAGDVSTVTIRNQYRRQLDCYHKRSA
jgi:transcription initiation factor TFIIB